MITIFTPTYNRAYLLNNLYQSLLLPTKVSFEWIIVDDGSTDATETLVHQFISENKISIHYIKQENKGKHFAINRGVTAAKGELFLILDSDDCLPKDALDLIYKQYLKIKDVPKFGGVAGRRNYTDGTIVGNSFDDEIITNSIDIRFKYKITGDLVEIFKTSVLREFPFPEIHNEKFCPEALLWNRIAQKYDLLFFNQGIYTTQYLPDGLTAKIVKIRMTSPIASMLTYSELASFDVPFKEKIKAIINYWRFSFNSSQSFITKLKRVNLLYSFIGLPIGYLMYKNDVKKYLSKGSK